MKVLSDKYIAGFLDADGWIGINKRNQLCMEFIQKTANDGVIDFIHQMLGGSRLTRVSKRRGTICSAARLVIAGKRAIGLLNRLHKHLVVKAQLAEDLLAAKEARVATAVSPKNHPSRKWLAGYFDGDGMVSACMNSSQSAHLRVSITANKNQSAGLELVQKAFGGNIRIKNNTARWEHHCDSAKIKQFLGYFSKHSLVKREQIYFALGCAAMGHFRDGATIVHTLKTMKTHPHRLNDLAASVDISSELANVRDLPRKPGQWYRFGKKCEHCGHSKLYAQGLCNPCYQKQNYWQKRQSA